MIFSKPKTGCNSPVDWAGRNLGQSEQPICDALFLPTLCISTSALDKDCSFKEAMINAEANACI